MKTVRSSIACNLDSHVLAAALPLFEAGKVEAIEWSFDSMYYFDNVPPWFLELIAAYSNEGRLLGHGVFFSLFSGKWKPEQQSWLDDLQRLSQRFTFDHITEHFGFMTGKNFHQGAPLSIPFNRTTLAIGQDRLQRIANACQCPVGLENLAFAYSLDEVKRHGEFLSKLVEPINGFLILDVHNLYCQLHNFDIDYDDLLSWYPLELVREIHISGGSWEAVSVQPDKKIRRDTHDDGVPDDVFTLLKKTITRCPNLKYVVLEQLGTGLRSPGQQERFRDDFYRMDKITQQYTPENGFSAKDFLPPTLPSLSDPVEDGELHRQQIALSDILESATDCDDARRRLGQSPLADSDWQAEQWQAAMLETAIAIAEKWKDGF